MIDTTRERAHGLDQDDPLAQARAAFVVADPQLIYLDGNSLGRLPKAVFGRIQQVVQEEWGVGLIRSWNAGWWEAPRRLGEMIAPLVGAAPGEVMVSDSTSINLFKLATAAINLRPGRNRVITDEFNFPSDLYVLEGIVRFLGNRHQIIRIGADDHDIVPDLDELESAIDENTALVTLSHVTFKSGYLYDMRAITDMAHRKGALVLWDMSHSVGAVPIGLDGCDADFAIGCTYKYLNGGPGAPAFLYVNAARQEEVVSPIWGWWGEARPFDFELDYQPGAGPHRFLTGTAPMLSMLAVEAALPLVLEAGIERLRQKSVALTEYAIELTDARLLPLGFVLGSPRDPNRRGSHVSLRHPDAYRINRALIEDTHVIPDFRAPDNIRLGFAPLYTTYGEVWEAIDRICRVMSERLFEKYSTGRLGVT